MRLSSKRRTDPSLAFQLPEADRSQVRIGPWTVDVLRMGEGDPVVLVPGLAGGPKLLTPLARRLARHHEVILYGLRGDRQWLGGPRALSIGTYAQDLAELLDVLGLETPTIFGVSFGGAIALELAAEFSHRVGALVISGVESRFRALTGARIARSALERFPLPSDSPFLNQFFNLLHAGKPQPGVLTDFITARLWETDQSVIASRLALLEDFDVTDRLWRIDVPTLVLAGSRDAIVSSTRQKLLADSIDGATFSTLDGAGHVGFLTHRAEVARQFALWSVGARQMPC